MQARVEREIPRNLPGRYAAVLSFVSASTRIIPLIIFSIYKTLHTKYRERQKERESERENERRGNALPSVVRRGRSIKAPWHCDEKHEFLVWKRVF